MSGPEIFGTDPYAASRTVEGSIVTVLRGVTDRRGLKLEAYRSRAVSAGQIHELMTTDERAEPGAVVDRIALIGFFEVTTGGVLLVGSAVRLGGMELGRIAGFDDTHMPNHQNICVETDVLSDGVHLGLDVERAVVIEWASS